MANNQPKIKTKHIIIRIEEAKREEYLELMDLNSESITEHLTKVIDAYIRRHKHLKKENPPG